MTRSRSKSFVLLLLVFISLALSFYLWQGNLHTTPEVGVSDLSYSLTSTTPKLTDVTQPFQIEISPHQGPVTLAQPSTQLYKQWMQWLADLHLYNIQPINVVPNVNGHARVQFDFGSEIDHVAITHFLPALETSPISLHASELLLVDDPRYLKVRLYLLSSTGTYVANTDVTRTEFTRFLTADLPTSWMQWNTNAQSFVPATPMVMPVYQIQLHATPILPLVHSFFVIPEALTRIQENPHQVLWTDGSRAVVLDESRDTLTYQDPNANAYDMPTTAPAAAIVKYIQAHGGGPSDGILFAEGGSQSKRGLSTVFTLRDYIAGYPVVGDAGAYQMTLQNNSLVAYTRPVNQLDGKLSILESDNVISGGHLASVLKKLMPTTTIRTLDVQLGYALTRPSQNVGILSPVYRVSQSGLWLWTINAYTGSVIQGAVSP